MALWPHGHVEKANCRAESSAIPMSSSWNGNVHCIMAINWITGLLLACPAMMQKSELCLLPLHAAWPGVLGSMALCAIQSGKP